MNRAFIRGLLSELEKRAEKGDKPAQQPQQPQMVMMPAIPPEVLAALMGEPEPQYEEPSMLQMMAPSIGLGAAGLGVGAAGSLAWPQLRGRLAGPMASLKANVAAKMPSLNPMRWFGKRGEEKVAGMPFLRQDRPAGVKKIFRALKRDHPGMSAELKARISSRQGKPGKQKVGPPYSSPLTKAAKKEDEPREDPPGVLGLILKAMRRIGKGRDPRMVMAFDRLSRNIPTNK